jgi:hypothetical protein
MADDDDQFDIDADSDIEDNNEGSDDDTDFFPIDEPIVHSSQSSHTTTTTSSSQISKPTRGVSDQSGNKYSTGVSASNNYPQDNSFEYIGKIFYYNFENDFFI